MIHKPLGSNNQTKRRTLSIHKSCCPKFSCQNSKHQTSLQRTVWLNSLLWWELRTIFPWSQSWWKSDIRIWLMKFSVAQCHSMRPLSVGRGVGIAGGGVAVTWESFCTARHFKTHPIHIPGLWKLGPTEVILNWWVIDVLVSDCRPGEWLSFHQ